MEFDFQNELFYIIRNKYRVSFQLKQTRLLFSGFGLLFRFRTFSKHNYYAYKVLRFLSKFRDKA